MPYRNPQDKREWEEANRSEERKRFKAAAHWADSQIATLDSISPRTETRRELRKDLIAQYLQTEYGEGADSSYSDPPTTE